MTTTGKGISVFVCLGTCLSLKVTNASDMKRQLLVICNICKWQGLFIQNDSLVSNNDGDMQAKELQVFNSPWNESGAPVSWLANLLHTSYYHIKKAIKLNMYCRCHFFLTTSMMPFVTSVSKEITAISKTDSQDFSQRNPRDQNAGIHRVPWGLGDLASVRVWLKKRNFRVRNWFESCHPMEFSPKK